ncbi:MAG TPA: hypothetical protein VMT89_01175 [Candidatus Acidoferrales bacterium]|nr:hypothetical protein [Candidatus Acidoferrales bacterium]
MRRVLAPYEQQSDEEALAEDEAAFEDSAQTFIEVPNRLVPAIRQLIAKQQAPRCRSRRRPKTGRA